MRHLHTKLIIIAMTMLPSLSWALPSDREKPINVEADHAQLDDQAGMTQYKGDAIVTQGTLRITGDIITFYYDENQEITKIISQGDLATYKQVQKPGEEPVRAKALQMEYYASSQKIYLLGKGHVWQAGDEFSGNKIEYDITKNKINLHTVPVKVAGKTQKPERIHIIIQPQGKKKKSTAPKITATTKVPAISEAAKSASSDKYATAFTKSSLNVRSGPAVSYNKIGVFQAQAEVMILTEQKDWVQVRGTANDKVIIGWVNRRYIQVSR